MICSRCCCRGCRFNGTRLDMSAKGQTEKNSVRANVFRVTPESGHCSIQSACLKGANDRQGRHPWTLRHIPDGEVAVTVRIARLPCRDPGKPRISKPVRELSGGIPAYIR